MLNSEEIYQINNQTFNKKSLLTYAESLKNAEEEFLQNIGIFLLQWFDENSFVEVKTSGTTGTPKNIVLQKKHMIASATATNLFFKLNKNHQSLLCLPAQYIAGKMMLVRALVSGMNIDFLSPNDIVNPTKKYNFVAMVPLQAEKNINQLHQFENIIIGGAPLNFVLKEKLKKIKSNIFETYGMTETITHIALKNIHQQYFTTLPNIKIKQNDTHCLCIKLPYLEEEIITNDRVKIYAENQFEWLGRIDNVINSGGVKLHPEEIENLLTPYINETFFITGMPDEGLGQKLVLVVEATHFSLDFKSIGTLHPYQIPKKVILVNQINKTENGKIIRKITHP